MFRTCFNEILVRQCGRASVSMGQEGLAHDVELADLTCGFEVIG